MSRHLVLMNPSSGGGTDALDVAARLRELIDCEFEMLTGPGEGRTRAARAGRDGFDVVVAAGGDGTVKEVIQGLVDGSDDADSAPLLAVLPLGTGNDLARTLDLPEAWEDAALHLRQPPVVRALDILEVELDGERTVSANAVIVGNGARVGEEMDERMKATWGPLSYIRAAVDVVFDLDPIEVQVSVDGGEPRTMDVLNLVLANGRYAGHGMPVAPGADPSDGSIEVAVVAACELSDVMVLTPSLLKGKQPEHEAYRQFKARTVGVRRADGGAIPVSVDGENSQAREIRVTCLPGRIRARTGWSETTHMEEATGIKHPFPRPLGSL